MGLIDKFRTTPIGSLPEEICESLRHLLGTKQGFGAWQRGLGLSDHGWANAPEQIVRNIMTEIQFNIETFEKRISLNQVRLISSKNLHSLCFEVEGELNNNRVSFFIFLRGARFSHVSLKRPTLK